MSASVFLIMFIFFLFLFLFWIINAGEKERAEIIASVRANERSFFVVLNYLVKKMRRGNPYTQLVGYEGGKRVPLNLLHVFREN